VKHVEEKESNRSSGIFFSDKNGNFGSEYAPRERKLLRELPAEFPELNFNLFLHEWQIMVKYFCNVT
jgi:hypothetical protein